LTAGRKTSRARRKRKIPRRYVVGIAALLLVVVAAGVAFLMYRSTLEQEDPLTDRVARMKPATMRVTTLRLYVPESDRGGLTWIHEELVAEHVDDTAIAKEAVRLWALRIAGSYGITTGRAVSPVDHIFLDQQGVVYVDFVPGFVSALNLGTTAEAEIQASLEQTLHANVPSIRRLVVMCEGAPLDTWGGHLGLRLESHR
jgi:hypothetical protein